MPLEAEQIHTAISRWRFAEGNEEKTETEEQKTFFQSGWKPPPPPHLLLLQPMEAERSLPCTASRGNPAGHLEDSDKLCHLKGYDN